MNRRRALCGSSNTSNGEPCKNPKDACPHAGHRRAVDGGGTSSTGRAALESATDDARHRERAAARQALTPPPAGSGLAADRATFIAAVRSAADAVGLPERQVVHDYWLVRALHGLLDVLPADGEVLMPAQKARHSDRRVGRWAFGGGTSLTAAWRVVERYSEDIDGNLFADEQMSPSAFAAVHRRISSAMCEAVEANDHETLGRNVRTTTVDLEGHPGFLRVETALEGPDDGLVVAQEVNSLIAVHSGMDLTGRYSEVGGFRIPCVRPEWTAVNKLDAMHRRSVTGDLEGLADRGRDLYDLWALAGSEHATVIRERTSELWERAASGTRTPVPRPDGGYGQSPALEFGSAANDALREGFRNAVALTVWGQVPTFEDAVESARFLDH